MTFKRFSIIAFVIALVIVLTTFVLGFVKTATPLHLDEPIAFYIYDHSSVSTKITKEDNPEEFAKLVSNLNNLTNISLAARLIQGGKLNEEPGQDADGVFGEITVDLVKFNHLVIEVVWEQAQQQIVSISGNKKVLKFYSFAFWTDNTSPRIIPICLSQSTPSSTNKKYDGSPLTVRGSTAEIYKTAKAILDK